MKGAYTMSTLLRREAGDRDRRVPEGGAVRRAVGQRVFEPVRVVPSWKLRPVMRPAALLTGQRPGHDGLRHLQEALQFQGLDQIGVEDLASILNKHERGAL